jgi:hypothetical protein
MLAGHMQYNVEVKPQRVYALSRLNDQLDEAATRRKSDASSHDVMRMVMSSILAA